ncbi:hypothetical protein HPG69_009196 [Diceros bicornis minor]|uniref:IRG-type G domain-containing protein n=1 Tax=Diceros bicornis minor TaxID=77932 RepID=A0A7J7EZS9_DICBM|nr:hypothetical protein HPG69_009196 [Diceros bicornis minor]
MASRIFQSSLSQAKVSELLRDTRALKEAFEAGNLPAIASKLQATLDLLENVRLDIGITGGTGSGKSTFVNAIQGLGDEDPNSACTGVVEMTVDPMPYPDPKYPNVIIWDLLGIGTPTFWADRYLKRVLLDHYNFFIIMTSERFTANHARLAREILRRGKRSYFIGSKVDVDVAASRSRRPSTFSEESALSQTRGDCGQRLAAGQYDFHLLGEATVKDLESHKRHTFLMALPNTSKPILERKAASLRRHIWLVATVARGVNLGPVLGVQDVACGLYALMHSLEDYRLSFGLDKDALA